MMLRFFLSATVFTGCCSWADATCIGYSDARHRNEDFCLGEGRFIVDGNLKRLQIGVQWIF